MLFTFFLFCYVLLITSFLKRVSDKFIYSTDFCSAFLWQHAMLFNILSREEQGKMTSVFPENDKDNVIMSDFLWRFFLFIECDLILRCN